MYCVKYTQNATGAESRSGSIPPAHHRLNLGAVLTENYSCKAHGDVFGMDSYITKALLFVQGHYK